MSYTDIAKCIFAQDRLESLFATYVYWLSNGAVVCSSDVGAQTLEWRLSVGADFFSRAGDIKRLDDFRAIANAIPSNASRVQSIDFRQANSVEITMLVSDLSQLCKLLAELLEQSGYPDLTIARHLRNINS